MIEIELPITRIPVQTLSRGAGGFRIRRIGILVSGSAKAITEMSMMKGNVVGMYSVQNKTTSKEAVTMESARE